jgi:hypothetical protein
MSIEWGAVALIAFAIVAILFRKHTIRSSMGSNPNGPFAMKPETLEGLMVFGCILMIAMCLTALISGLV